MHGVSTRECRRGNRFFGPDHSVASEIDLLSRASANGPGTTGGGLKLYDDRLYAVLMTKDVLSLGLSGLDACVHQLPFSCRALCPQDFGKLGWLPPSLALCS